MKELIAEIEALLFDPIYDTIVKDGEIEIRDSEGRKVLTATTKGEKTVFFRGKMYDLDIYSILKEQDDN